jgi:hypothetical protein
LGPFVISPAIEGREPSASEWSLVSHSHFIGLGRKKDDRNIARGGNRAMFLSLWFLICVRYERVHPLEGGYFRLRDHSRG